jgi:hypothetical protein
MFRLYFANKKGCPIEGQPKACGNAVLPDQYERLLCLDLSWGSWFGRKLEHCCLLTFEQASQEHNLTFRKLQRIVMCILIILVDLPEDSCGVIKGTSFPTEDPARLTTYFRCKGKLGSRKYTYRNVRVFRRSEACGATVEMAGREFVTNLGRSRPNVV